MKHSTTSHAVNWKNNLTNEILWALDHEQFILYYQPQYELKSHQLIGAEVLLRWKHPEKGLILPDFFIPLAEKNGCIEAMTLMVCQKICCQLEKIMRYDLNLKISINIPANLFSQKEFMDSLQGLLNNYSKVAHLLSLEITESSPLVMRPELLRRIRQLKQQGISIIIDDFGTGHADLSYLSYLPVNQVKIDKSYIQELTTNRKKLLITKAIIHLCHELGIKVVAEGVETEDQLRVLREYNCDYIQGYIWGAPMPEVKFFAIIEESNLWSQVL